MNRHGDKFILSSSPVKLQNAYHLAVSALESVGEALLAVDEEHNPIIYNQNFVDMWRFDPESDYGAGKEGRIRMMAEQVKMPEQFRARALELLVDLEIESRDIFEMKDGRIIESYARPFRLDGRIIESYARPFRLDGRIIGRLYRFQDISTRKTAERTLRFRDRILEATVFASETFLKSQEWEDAIPDVLARLGEAASVSRVYLFLADHRIDGPTGFMLKEEWTANNIQSRFDIPDYQSFSVQDEGFGRWSRILRAGESLAGVLTDFPEAERKILERLNIQSTALAPVFSGNQWVGVLGFDECVEARVWLSAVLDAMKMAAGSLGAAMQRKAYDDILVRARDAAEKANTAKSMFLAGVSHEIRNSMNAVIGLTDLALKTDLTPRQHNFIQKASVSSHNLLEVVNDLLDLSKIEAGKLEIEKIAFNIRDLMDDIADMFTASLIEKRLDIFFIVERNVPFSVLGDPVRIKQVLINLIGNAVKFTEAGEIAVSVKIAETSGESMKLAFSVSDSGIGIVGDHIHRLFSPFSQADGSTTRKYGGTGLGLAISKQLVELMGGSINVRSKADKGTQFSFDLSVEAAGGEMGSMSSLPAPSFILLVSDSEAQRKALMEAAASLGGVAHETTVPKFDAEWLPPVIKDGPPPRCVFLDTTASSLDPKRLIEKFCQNNYYRDTSLILLGGGKEDRDNAFKDSERIFFLNKPLKFRTFGKAVKEFLQLDEQGMARFPEEESNEPARYFVRGLYVLIAEDDPINREVLIEILTGEGVGAFTVKDGEEAVRAVTENHFDAVLMDVEMDGGDGFTATKEIRKVQEQRSASGLPAPEIPIIAMTGRAMIGDKEACLDAGMNDYLTKPIIPDQLFRMLEKWTCENRNVFERESEACVETTRIEPYANIPFQIDGVNVVKGVERLQGDQQTYIKLVRNFIRNYIDVPSAIREKLEHHDFRGALGMIHKLKGTALNLSAETIARIASELEIKIMGNSLASVTPALEQIEDALAEISESLRDLNASRLRQNQSSIDSGMNHAGKDLQFRDVLNKLRRYLDDGDSDSEMLLPAVKEFLFFYKLGDMYEQLESQLLTFQYEAAKDTLNEIAGRL